MEDINDENCVRYIPADIKRIVRKEALFGCVKCGMPIIEYHHIIPWSQVHKHEADNLVIVCPCCHQKIHNRLITKEQLLSLKKLPYNKNKLIVRDVINIHDMVNLTIHIGGCAFNNVDNILKISGKDMIFFKREDNKRFLNALFYNKNGIVEAAIVDNEWMVFIKDNTWDVTYSGGVLKVRNINKDILLNISINLEEESIKLTGEMYYEKHKIVMKDDLLSLINLINGSQLNFQNVSMIDSNTAISL